MSADRLANRLAAAKVWTFKAKVGLTRTRIKPRSLGPDSFLGTNGTRRWVKEEQKGLHRRGVSMNRPNHFSSFFAVVDTRSIEANYTVNSPFFLWDGRGHSLGQLSCVVGRFFFVFLSLSLSKGSAYQCYSEREALRWAKSRESCFSESLARVTAAIRITSVCLAVMSPAKYTEFGPRITCVDCAAIRIARLAFAGVTFVARGSAE